ncbi:MAG: L,D-transpeptidase family protein [gamma proteobacterium symbiont of Lucinoma myriamae]|nr:L,D-transpeptidase family protein [gamma proteobacterium symbiont of Lucinoma myriamae]MCU7818079.1 L,D-transpeptidase family protein [gamma proteobacterium symbiont of Lucinoma myriamae]MCU7832425.1 L,D-transpeptidase family protein [gamma proteobacterium symbiont of Lucinoma myriamae]
MSVLDFKGKIINPDNVNWSSISAKGFPYMIRQEPGPSNALGRVKFMFPNKHMVYLHDTHSQSKFKKAERAFSSGCIRIENPFELVELLLKDSKQWNQDSFKEILDSGKLQNVNLPQSVPVLLLYFTAYLNENGEVLFFKDIYKRDEKIIEGLMQPFQFAMPNNRP